MHELHPAMLPVTSRLEIKHGGAVVGGLFRCCVLGEIVMSGRGRGKSFGSLEAIGIKPGDRIPPPILQPTASSVSSLSTYAKSPDHDLLCIKQRLRQFMRQFHFFLKSEISGSNKRSTKQPPRAPPHTCCWLIQAHRVCLQQY